MDKKRFLRRIEKEIKDSMKLENKGKVDVVARKDIMKKKLPVDLVNENIPDIGIKGKIDDDVKNKEIIKIKEEHKDILRKKVVTKKKVKRVGSKKKKNFWGGILGTTKSKKDIEKEKIEKKKSEKTMKEKENKKIMKEREKEKKRRREIEKKKKTIKHKAKPKLSIRHKAKLSTKHKPIKHKAKPTIKAKKSSLNIFKKITRLIKRKKEEEDQLKSGFIRRLNRLKKQKQNSTTIEQLNHLFRIFLKEKFKIKESLTVDEIKIEFKKSHKKIKTRILYLLIKIQDLEYNQNTVERKEVEKLIEEIKHVAKIS